MLIFFNWNIRIRNTFIFFALLWFYFFDSSWIQFSSWIIFFGVCVVTADLDEDKIGDTFEEFYDEVMGNYSEITNKDWSISEDTWIVQEQLKHHLTNYPRDIEELLAYREKQTKDDIIKEARKSQTYEERLKHIKYQRFYTEGDEVEYYTSEGLEVKFWVLQVVADWWYADEHLIMPEVNLNEYAIIDILVNKQSDKVLYEEAKQKLIQEQLDPSRGRSQRRITPYKRLLRSWKEKTVRSEPVFWPRPNIRQPKSKRSFARATKMAKQNRHKLTKYRIDSMPIEFPSSDQLQHYIVQRFGNTLCFQPDLAVGIAGKRLRSIIYSKEQLPSNKLNWRLINRRIRKEWDKNESDWNYDPDIIRAGMQSGDVLLPRPRPKGWSAKLKERAKQKASHNQQSAKLRV